MENKDIVIYVNEQNKKYENLEVKTEKYKLGEFERYKKDCGRDGMSFYKFNENHKVNIVNYIEDGTVFSEKEIVYDIGNGVDGDIYYEMGGLKFPLWKKVKRLGCSECGMEPFYDSKRDIYYCPEHKTRRHKLSLLKDRIKGVFKI